MSVTVERTEKTGRIRRSVRERGGRKLFGFSGLLAWYVLPVDKNVCIRVGQLIHYQGMNIIPLEPADAGCQPR